MKILEKQKKISTVKVIVGESRSGATGITGRSISKTLIDANYKEVADIIFKKLKEVEEG